MRVWINHCEGVGCRVKTTGVTISAKLTVRDLKCLVAEKLRKVVNSFYLVYNKNGLRVLLTDTFTLKFFGLKRVSIVNVFDIPHREIKDTHKTSAKPALESQGSLESRPSLLPKKPRESLKSPESLESELYILPQRSIESVESQDIVIEAEDLLTITRKRSHVYTSQNIIPNKLLYNLLEQSIEASKNGDIIKLQQVVLTIRSVAKEPYKVFNMTDGNGWSCLHYACIGGHLDVIKFLLAFGVYVNLESNNHWLPIQLVASIGNLDCLKQLLNDPNIQINKMTKNRGTALHIATELGYMECVSALLIRKAARNIEDFRGRLPNSLASSSVILNMLNNVSSASTSTSSSTIGSTGMKGVVYYTKSLILHDYEVFLDLNFEEGTLDRYKTESDLIEGRAATHKIPIMHVHEIKVCQEAKGNDIYHYFFIIKVNDQKFKYYTLNKNTTAGWVNAIKKAIDYSHSHVKHFLSKLEEQLHEEHKAETASIVEIDPSLSLNGGKKDPKLEKHYTVERSADVIEPVPEIKPLTQEHKEPVSLPEQSPVSAPALESSSSKPSSSEPSNLDVELSLNSFITEELLGTGSFGRVHRVKHKSTGQIFAIKILNKRFLQKQRLLKYAISECKILRDLDHPFILSIHYSFQDNQDLYMVLDYCPNKDLEFLINQFEKLSEDDVRFYTAEVLCALQYMHERDTVYRDLKPANILIAEDGHIKLADFGLAKEGVKEVRAATTFAGTPVYMAPEIMNGSGYGKSADIYSLGVLIYELLAGVPPYHNPDPLQLYKLIEKADLNVPKHFSKAANDLVKKLLKKSPGKRLSFQDIKKHAFFKGVDWAAYPLKQHKAPAASFLAKECITAGNYKDDSDYANF